MSDTLAIAAFTLAGTIMGALIGPLILARFSKPKRERDAGLAEVYLKLADMTATELQERMDTIVTLDKKQRATDIKLRQQELENEELKIHRADRDEKIEALESAAAALKAQVEKDVEETKRLRNDYANAQKQIIKLENLVIGAGEYIEEMKNAMIKANIPLPMNGELRVRHAAES